MIDPKTLNIPFQNFHLFYDGPFSQWSHSPFEIGGVTYNCAEQWMMSEKARVHGADDIREQIMKAKHPAKQKELGRKIANFDSNLWKAEAKMVVYRGTAAKFDQNDDHCEALFKTKGMTLVEASPSDRIWGIGLPEENIHAKDPTQWLGTNWLGEIITLFRIDTFGS